MTINGYQIREAIKRWTLRRDTAHGLFKEGLHRFPDSVSSPHPIKVMMAFEEADRYVAQLEEIQQRFNSIVTVNLTFGFETKMTLARAVKLVGGAGRMEKMWREASVSKKDRYSVRDELVRQKDTIYAEPTMTREEILEYADNASRYASCLRNAIAKGNSSEVNSESLGIPFEKKIFE